MASEYEYRNADRGCASAYLLPMLEEILSDLPPGARVMDMGCGNGSTLAALSSHRWTMHGLDISVSGIENARRAYPSIAFDVADLTADVSMYPLAGTFDAVISTEVIEHVLLPRRFVANCRAMLKPNGRIVISTPYHGYLKNLALAISGKMDAHFTALWDYGHIKFWSKRTLIALLEESGFSQFRFYGVGRWPYVWKSMIVAAKLQSR